MSTTASIASESDRIVQRGDKQWYIRARGNSTLGPYPSREIANRALEQQLLFWSPPKAPRQSRFLLTNLSLFKRSFSRQR